MAQSSSRVSLRKASSSIRISRSDCLPRATASSKSLFERKASTVRHRASAFTIIIGLSGIDQTDSRISRRFSAVRSASDNCRRATSFASVIVRIARHRSSDVSLANMPIWQRRLIASPLDAIRLPKRQSSIAFNSASVIMIGMRWSLSSSVGFFLGAMVAVIHILNTLHNLSLVKTAKHA